MKVKKPKGDAGLTMESLRRAVEALEANNHPPWVCTVCKSGFYVLNSVLGVRYEWCGDCRGT